MKITWWLNLLFAFILSESFGQQSSTTYLFVGSYTDGKPDTGIYVYSFNTRSGAPQKISSVDHITNPSFITLSPDGRYLYACADTKMPDTGSVMAFSMDAAAGKLTMLNKQTSGGDNPVYVDVHNSNKYLINANYTGGSVSAYAINENGSLNPPSQVISFEGSSVISGRQQQAHIHAAVFSPKGDYVYLPDLGSDKIRLFRFDTSQLQPLIPMASADITSVPGSGPRHLTFHPKENFAYCIEELSGTVTSYLYEEGELHVVQRISSYRNPGDFYWSADIHISPDGQFLYASNRREDENTIAIFSIQKQTGLLALVGHQSTYGDHPRNFTIDPTGRFLLVANMLTNNIVVFKRNMKTGMLKKTKYEIAVKNPSCLQMRGF